MIGGRNINSIKMKKYETDKIQSVGFFRRNYDL